MSSHKNQGQFFRYIHIQIWTNLVKGVEGASIPLNELFTESEQWSVDWA